jgi:hypothetical protein
MEFVTLARKVRLICAATLALTAVAAFNESVARATDVATQLEYSAAHGCPSAADFEAVVVGRLGYSPFRVDAPARVIVRIEPSGRILEGRLEWRDTAGGWIGEQTFPSRTGDCGELARAMGFALALQIQLMAATAAERHPPPPPPPVTATAAPLPAPPAPPPTAPPAVPPAAVTTTSSGEAASSGPRSPGPSVLVGAGAAVGVGIAASAVPLGRLLGTLRWSHVAIEVAGEVSAPSTTRRADGAGFAQQQLLASLAGCGVRNVWSACVVAKVGQIRVVGQDVDVPTTSAGLVAQTGVRVAVTHAVGGRFEIGVHADGLALITQGTVTLDSIPVWTTPRFAALLGAELGVRFR